MSHIDADRLAPYLLRIRLSLTQLEATWGACEAGTRWLYDTTIDEAEALRAAASALCELLGEMASERGGVRRAP